MKKWAVLVLVVLLLATGCSTFKRLTGQEEQQPLSKSEAPNVAYYSFPDIPIPKELELVRDRSFVYETSNLRTGLLVLSGNVDINSLEQYFKTNMAKNGWRFINSFKYATVILNYLKDDKAAHIRISRENFSTWVEIWVGPLDKPMGMGAAPERR
jgi:hypothetical protein